MPYRYSFFPYSNVYGFDAASIDAKKPLLRAEHYGLVPEVSRSGVQSFLEAIHENPDTNGLPIALLFPTRPFVIPEFYLVVPALFTARPKGDAAAWARAFRGLDLRRLPRRTGDTIHVDFRSVDRRLRIGLASWETSRESWKAAAATVRDPDVSRYGRLNRLLNEALHSAARPRYLILPELAIPPQWFFGIASRLAASGVSLVSGVEYLPSGGGSVANQVWVSLVADFPNYRSFVVYRQDKQRAALHEESELWAVGGKRLVPETRYNEVPRIRHGDFLFATLVCSELTDIRRRASLRGRIDALFVPEWNKDTETFSALVESAALDVHAYIIQCNDRAFGDTRIRAPAREPWARDVVKVKGGVSDYLVVGEIDVESLRRFQSHHRSPVGPACDKIKFKPVPDGFEISADRRRLPG